MWTGASAMYCITLREANSLSVIQPPPEPCLGHPMEAAEMLPGDTSDPEAQQGKGASPLPLRCWIEDLSHLSLPTTLQYKPITEEPPPCRTPHRGHLSNKLAITLCATLFIVMAVTLFLWNYHCTMVQQLCNYDTVNDPWQITWTPSPELVVEDSVASL